MTRRSEPQPELAVGDYVTLTGGPGALTWQIIAIHPDASAYGDLYTLASGQSGRRRFIYGNPDQLTFHSRSPE